MSNKNFLISLSATIILLVSIISITSKIQDKTYKDSCAITTKIEYQPGEQLGYINHDGKARKYLLYIPTSAFSQKNPALVLVLHGGFNNASIMKSLSKFNDVADNKGFIVVYPNGVKGRWNDGRADAKPEIQNIDDVGFIEKLIDKIAENIPINQGRVYSTGISNGGLMSYRLACELSEKIKGIAAVAANLPEKTTYSCDKVTPLKVLIVNGTTDPIMPWEGGEVNVGIFGHRGTVLSTKDTVDFWLSHNSCQDTETTVTVDNKKDGTQVIKHFFANCSVGTKVYLYEVVNGGHTWPGESRLIPERLFGKTSREINTSEETWSFFTN